MGCSSMVTVNAIPDVPNVLMCRAAAQHLYRLLARYNWCLRDPRQFEERWRLFWPTLRWCERAIVRLCLAAQGGLRVGQRLRPDRLDMDVDEGTAHQPVRMSSDVEAEFVRVLGLYYQRLTTRAEMSRCGQINCRRLSPPCTRQRQVRVGSRSQRISCPGACFIASGRSFLEKDGLQWLRSTPQLISLRPFMGICTRRSNCYADNGTRL